VTLSEPSRTQFDLSWRMFGIPVRIHPMFWLVGTVLGWYWAQRFGLTYLAVFLACMLVSILVHELGHVFMGRVFGARSYIVLYGFGGLAIGSLEVRGTWRRVAVLLAGPGAGFLLYGLVRFALVAGEPTLGPYMEDPPNPVWAAFVCLLWMNLVWNLLNLLPIWPLDGGQVCAELLIRALGERGLKIALVISIALAGLIALRAFFPEQVPVPLPLLGRQRDAFAGIMFLLIAAENVQVLSQLNQDRRDWR
jgi:stage IV sporulation protein FB